MEQQQVRTPFSGPLRKEIQGDVWKLDIISFDKVENEELLNVIENIPDFVKKDFSKDFEYLIEMARAILQGYIEDRWAKMKSGNIHQALLGK